MTPQGEINARINARRSLRVLSVICAVMAALFAATHELAASAGFVIASLLAVIARSSLHPKEVLAFLAWFETSRKPRESK